MTDRSPFPKRNLHPTKADLNYTDSVPANPKAAREGAKLPYVPPVIETLYPSSTGLPPGVFEEWGGECMRCSEANGDDRHELRLAQSQ